MEINKEIIKASIKRYGEKNQLVVSIEELSELQKEICKTLRAWNEGRKIDDTQTIEEIADVYICLGLIEEILDLGESRIEEQIKAKQTRLVNRMLEESRTLNREYSFNKAMLQLFVRERVNWGVDQDNDVMPCSFVKHGVYIHNCDGCKFRGSDSCEDARAKWFNSYMDGRKE